MTVAAKPVEAVAPGRPVRAGSGFVRIGRGATGSAASRVCAASPLRVLTPRNHGTAAWIYTSTLGGGLLDGDDVRLRIEVDAGAAGFVSSQASTKVYRSVDGCAAMRVDATVGDGALLVVAPDPVVCFAHSRYEQAQRIDVEGAGGIVFVDWFTSGRHATGEQWAFHTYRSRSEINREGRLAWYDAVLLDPADGRIGARMGGYEVFATVAIAGAQLEAHVARALTAIPASRAASGERVIAAGSPIGADGCVIRIAGTSVEAVGHAIRRCLAFVPELIGDDPWARRW